MVCFLVPRSKNKAAGRGWYMQDYAWVFVLYIGSCFYSFFYSFFGGCDVELWNRDLVSGLGGSCYRMLSFISGERE